MVRTAAVNRCTGPMGVVSTNKHRATLHVPSDYTKPWKIRAFERCKGFYRKCGTCVALSKRGFYNRAAFRRGDDYVYTIRRAIQ